VFNLNKKLLILIVFLVLALFIISACQIEPIGARAKCPKSNVEAQCSTPNSCLTNSKPSYCNSDCSISSNCKVCGCSIGKICAGTGKCVAITGGLLKKPVTYLLTVTKSGTGSGTITSDPRGINCGTACTKNYNSGTQVKLTAAQDSSSEFKGWSGACSGTGSCTVIIDNIKNVNAQFELGAGASNIFSDDFSSYNLDCSRGGTSFGSWYISYVGSKIEGNILIEPGCVKIETINGNKVLHENPAISTDPLGKETHASLVIGLSFPGNLNYEVSLQTEEQLRINYPAKAWEVAWIFWHYTDNNHFYYFSPRPNGWSLGKEYPDYTGNQKQRNLARGNSPLFPIGSWYNFKINQVNNLDGSVTIKVYVKDQLGNYQLITTVTDLEQPYPTEAGYPPGTIEKPYTSGKIGLYNEDAHVHFDNVRVS